MFVVLWWCFVVFCEIVSLDLVCVWVGISVVVLVIFVEVV